jgi:hypothetical protein
MGDTQGGRGKMMDEFVQLKAEEDDCIYLFNPEKGIAGKICDIINVSEYPPSIVRQIRELKKNAGRLPDV